MRHSRKASSFALPLSNILCMPDRCTLFQVPSDTRETKSPAGGAKLKEDSAQAEFSFDTVAVALINTKRKYRS